LDKWSVGQLLKMVQNTERIGQVSKMIS